MTDAAAVKSGGAATKTKMDTTTKRAKSTKEEKIVSRFDSSFLCPIFVTFVIFVVSKCNDPE